MDEDSYVIEENYMDENMLLGQKKRKPPAYPKKMQSTKYLLKNQNNLAQEKVANLVTMEDLEEDLYQDSDKIKNIFRTMDS